nr:MAG TPA: hypothetical protein [Caudoviricetes sp.]
MPSDRRQDVCRYRFSVAVSKTLAQGTTLVLYTYHHAYLRSRNHPVPCFISG